jgi:hypothetical protein
MTDLYASPRSRAPEEHLSAVLLRMVLDHCTRPEGTLDSFGRLANAEAMRLLAEHGFIRIHEQAGDRLRATVTPEAKSFLAWMAKADS